MVLTNPTAARIVHSGHLLEATQARTPHVREPSHASQPSAGRRFLSFLRTAGRGGVSSVGHLNESHDLFVGHDQEQLARIGRFFTVIDVPSGTMLGRQGRIAREFVAILEGQVGVTIDGVPHAVLDDGSHFGALPLLDEAPGAPHSASFTVMAPSRIAVANAAEFHSLLAKFRLVAERVQAMTDVRRAYLAGLAHISAAERPIPDGPTVDEYPVHVVQRISHISDVARTAAEI